MQKFSLLVPDTSINASINTEALGFWDALNLYTSTSAITKRTLDDDFNLYGETRQNFVFSLILSMYSRRYTEVDKERFLPCTEKIKKSERDYILKEDKQGRFSQTIGACKSWNEVKYADLFSFVIKRNNKNKIVLGNKESGSFGRMSNLSRLLMAHLGFYDMYQSYDRLRKWLTGTEAMFSTENEMFVDDLICALVHHGYIRSEFNCEKAFSTFLQTISNLKCALLGYSTPTRYYVRSLEDIATIFCIANGYPITYRSEILLLINIKHSLGMSDTIGNVIKDIVAQFKTSQRGFASSFADGLCYAAENNPLMKRFCDHVDKLIESNYLKLKRSLIKQALEDNKYLSKGISKNVSVPNILIEEISNILLSDVDKTIDLYFVSTPIIDQKILINDYIFLSVKRTVKKIVIQKYCKDKTNQLTKRVSHNLSEIIKNQEQLVDHIYSNPLSFTVLRYNSMIGDIQERFNKNSINELLNDLRNDLKEKYMEKCISIDQYMEIYLKIFGRQAASKKLIDYINKRRLDSRTYPVVEQLARSKSRKQNENEAAIYIKKECDKIQQCLEDAKKNPEVDFIIMLKKYKMQNYMHDFLQSRDDLEVLLYKLFRLYIYGFDKLIYVFNAPRNNHSKKTVNYSASFAIPSNDSVNRSAKSMSMLRNALIIYMVERKEYSLQEINDFLNEVGFVELMPGRIDFDATAFSVIKHNEDYTRQKLYNLLS